MAAPETPPESEVPEGAGLAEHPLTSRRLDKVSRLRDRGVEPYPLGYDRDAAAADLHERYGSLEPDTRTGVEVRVAGRLMNTRRLGRLIFGVLQDYSGQIQLFAEAGGLGEDGLAGFEDLDLGDWIWARGEVMTTRRGELSVHLAEFALLAKSLRPLPAKWHGLKDTEVRFRRRELDLLVNPESRRIAEVRAGVVSELRRQFEDRGFVEVETPVLQVQAGGALARPFETYHNALGLPMYLRIATELHLKRLVVGGMERVFELGRVFRNEGIDAKHNPEFTTLEAYQALADYHDIMRLMEEVIPAVAERVIGTTQLAYQGRPLDLRPPYRRVPMLDLVSESWLGALVRRCADAACGAYIALTYDGEVQWMAESAAGWRVDHDPDDGLVREAVNRHQRGDKGFGPALGPAAAPLAARLFRDAGYRTWLAGSGWRLEAADRRLTDRLVEGWAAAAAELRPDAADRVAAWRGRRRAALSRGSFRVTVGHRDLLALPGDAE